MVSAASQYIPYTITEGFLLIYALTVLFRLSDSIGSEHEVQVLRYMLYAYIAMLVTDAISVLGMFGLISAPHFLFLLSNAIDVISILLGCYLWYRYVEDRLAPRFASNKVYRVIISIPVIFAFVADFSSIFTGMMFTVDASNYYKESDLFVVQGVINYFYLAVPSLAALVYAFRSSSRTRRSEYLTYTTYIIVPLISGLLEEVVPTVPILALSIFMIIHILFLMIQNMQIYNDALTNLNNRRRLNHYLENRLPTVSSEHPIVLFMLDINRFKSINDTFGHIEDDHALITFADALRAISGMYDAFIARYGGDEFCLVADVSEHTPEEIRVSVNDSLARTLAARDSSVGEYAFSVSMGYAICDESTSDVDGLIRRADEMLYREKRKWHRQNA